jgi:hypothetical protein
MMIQYIYWFADQLLLNIDDDTIYILVCGSIIANIDDDTRHDVI